MTAPEPVRDRRWGLGDVLAGMAIGLAVSQVVLSIVLAATDRSVDQVDELPLSLVLLSQAGLWVGLLGVPWYATRRKGGGLVADLDLRARWRDLWVGGSLGAALQLVALPLLYWPLLELLDKTSTDLEEPARELTDRADGAIGVVLLFLIVGIGAPIVEEVFYRGLMLGALRKRGLSAGVSVAITAVVFGLSHAQLLQLPALALFGAVAGALVVRHGRLGPAIAAHVAFNMVTVIALLAL
ncbi:MAG TPA: CPBP family intramembrane glutamic endopeptidase [Acidimicrobiales bacterium]|nr:CPBP family intramembrane glutamic endopeptidase [Acidimicrobiales bacterium]